MVEGPNVNGSVDNEDSFVEELTVDRSEGNKDSSVVEGLNVNGLKDNEDSLVEGLTINRSEGNEDS